MSSYSPFRPSSSGPAALLACAGVLLVAPRALATTVWNAATDFSASVNPNNEWSFGYENPPLGSGFNPESSNGSVNGLDYWGTATGPNLPAVLHNPSISTTGFWGTGVIDPGQLVLHPGPLGELSITRFTALLAGTYTFSADFIGQDNVIGTTTDVYLRVNTNTLFSGNVAGYHNVAASGTFVMALSPGDTIDAAVGFGANGNFYGDTTGLDFNVNYVPTPGAAGLFGAASLLAVRRRR